ncbi:Hpt domain-containing protein [Duganella sp. LX20W]|uniref:Hpt domain-containing protein n=2 Tax=Rugamonas brunnea TaxID=2758569 RepID=A0A7W2EWC9_9BURK|nr:Hpt domain-containing protein [Rugamonas brunnea]
MGDRALYLQLLHRFRDDYCGLGLQLRLALAGNSLATLRPRVHMLRGAAGMIGARAVCQLAAALEPACHLPAAACTETVLLLDEALCALLASIETLLDTEALTASAGAGAGAEVEAAAGAEARAGVRVGVGAKDGAAPAPTLAGMPNDPTGPVANDAVLARLASLLDIGDGAALDVLEQSASSLAARLGVERYQRVAAAAHQFDFEAALAALAPHL